MNGYEIQRRQQEQAEAAFKAKVKSVLSEVAGEAPRAIKTAIRVAEAQKLVANAVSFPDIVKNFRAENGAEYADVQIPTALGNLSDDPQFTAFKDKFNYKASGVAAIEAEVGAVTFWLVDPKIEKEAPLRRTVELGRLTLTG